MKPSRGTAFAAAEEVFARIENDEEPHRKRGPKPQPIADMAAFFDRRKALLRRRYARHWDMIWYLRSRHMSGRTLRAIYGDECLIWSVGGGIDGEVS